MPTILRQLLFALLFISFHEYFKLIFTFYMHDKKYKKYKSKSPFKARHVPLRRNQFQISELPLRNTLCMYECESVYGFLYISLFCSISFISYTMKITPVFYHQPYSFLSVNIYHMHTI